MKTNARWLPEPLLAAFRVLAFLAPRADTSVVHEGNRICRVDRTGERWNISLAVSIGFDPDRFEFGIGRHAFTPLDDSHLQPGSTRDGRGMRVIGVAGDGAAHAYAVRKRRDHETANTFLGSAPITAAY